MTWVLAAAALAAFTLFQRRHQAALESLRASEASLLEAQRIGKVGSWDLRGGRLSWSDEHFRLYGCVAGTFSPTVEDWTSRVHEEDRGALSAALEAAARQGKGFTLEARVPGAGGRVTVLLVTGEARPGSEPYAVHGISHDVTQQKAAAAKSEARQKEALQREFMANVSHELRTPVAAIKGFAESLREGALQDPKVSREFVRIIEKHAERLSVIVESLLDVSALESGRRPAVPETVPLSSFVWGLAENLAPAARRRRLSLRVKVPGELQVWMDPGHLARALQNLCENAIQFNREGGEVEVSASHEGDRVRICVRDTGVGILPEDVPHVFERFHQRKRSRQKLGGAGLGLSIVKSVVESNGGQVKVAETSGEGTVFHLVVPASKDR